MNLKKRLANLCNNFDFPYTCVYVHCCYTEVQNLDACTRAIHSQVSEASTTQRAEEKGAKVMRLEASLLRSEQELERVREALLQARTHAHKRTKHLRTTVQVRKKCVINKSLWIYDNNVIVHQSGIVFTQDGNSAYVILLPI